MRLLGGNAPWYGLADVWIDDNYIATIDGSRPNDFAINPFFMSPVLREGSHLLKVLNKAESGHVKTDDRHGLSIMGFDVLPNGSGVCLSQQAPVSWLVLTIKVVSQNSAAGQNLFLLAYFWQKYHGLEYLGLKT